MGKTRLQHRLDTIEVLSNYKIREKKENERLKRKKEMLEQTMLDQFTITGTIEEINMELKRIKKEKKENIKNLQKIIHQIYITVSKYSKTRCTY